MPYTVYLLDLAKEDISNCARWITKNQDSTGILASYFLDAVEQTLERLKIAPKLFPIRHDDVRGISVKREGPKGEPQQFPHLIYYRLKNADIFVVQVLAMRDNPKKIRLE